jgi:hypothetical protein
MIVVEVGVKTQCKIYGCRSTHQNEYTRELNWVQNNSIFLDSVVNLTKINKNRITALFT